MSILDGFGAVGLQIHAMSILGSCGRPAAGICLIGFEDRPGDDGFVVSRDPVTRKHQGGGDPE